MNKIKLSVMFMILLSFSHSDSNAFFFPRWLISTPKAFVGFCFTYIRKNWSPVIFREEFDKSEAAYNTKLTSIQTEFHEKMILCFKPLRQQVQVQSDAIEAAQSHFEALKDTMASHNEMFSNKIQELREAFRKKSAALIKQNTQATRAQLLREKRMFERRLHAMMGLKKELLQMQRDTKKQYNMVLCQLEQKRDESIAAVKLVLQGQLESSLELENEVDRLQNYFNRSFDFEKPQTKVTGLSSLLNSKNHSIIAPQLLTAKI